MKVKSSFFKRGSFKVGVGQSMSFWEDTWLGDNPLALQYMSLYNVVCSKDVIVHSVLGITPLNIQFRRAMIGDKWTAWLHLVRRLMLINLSQTPHVFQ